MNAELHYDALVSISNMKSEFDELYREVKALGPGWESRSIYEFVEAGDEPRFGEEEYEGL